MSYLKHFVLQHQNYEKLFDYSLRNNMVVYQRVDGLNRNADEPVLSECCRLLLLRLIRMIIDFFDSNLCFDAFTFNDIMIDLAYDNVPRLVTGLTTNTATPGGIDRNLSSLVDVIEKGVLSRSSGLPHDLTELFKLMRNNGHKNIDIINVHSSLIPLENVRELFLRMHSEYFDLKKSSPTDYITVSQGIIFPAGWELKIQSNK